MLRGLLFPMIITLVMIDLALCSEENLNIDGPTDGEPLPHEDESTDVTEQLPRNFTNRPCVPRGKLSSLESLLPAWVYKCVTHEKGPTHEIGCLRSTHPLGLDFQNNSFSVPVYESIAICQTVCGRFGGLWPRPFSAMISPKMIKIHPDSIQFNLQDVPPKVRPFLARMSEIALDNLKKECWGGNVTERSLYQVAVLFTVKTKELDLDWDTDEGYTLDVKLKEGTLAVNIVAETVFGARHALETFTQLVAPLKPEFTHDLKCGLLITAGANIKDRPAYKHRGFMLDTSRNFIPIEDIQRMIDAMAAVKMNVFHWHVTDSHSFPLESIRVPQFTRYGAFSPMEIYSKEEVASLINYAKVRGVRVIIEIDTPSHAGNGWQWGQEYGFGDLAVCVNAQPWRDFCVTPPCGQLNPANPRVYNVIRDLYRDLSSVLPMPPLLHVGGDEVAFSCWNSSEEIRDYMKYRSYDIEYEGFFKLWADFQEKILMIWDEELAARGVKNEQQVIIWSSELTKPHRITRYLNKERYVIQVWEAVHSRDLNRLIHMGYRVISAPKDVWYLDHGFWGSSEYSSWKKMYAHRLPDLAGVLGGEVAMWTEFVDFNSLDNLVWPRAAAVAERLWSNPPQLATTRSAEPRLQRMRDRLISRGIRCNVLTPTWCMQNTYQCS